MPTKKVLYAKAKEYGIKRISRMTKQELEDAVFLRCSIDWFNDIAGNKITIIDSPEPEIEVLDIDCI